MLQTEIDYRAVIAKSLPVASRLAYYKFAHFENRKLFSCRYTELALQVAITSSCNYLVLASNLITS